MRIAVLLVVFVVGAALYLTLFRKDRGPDPRYLERVAATRGFLTENRARIDEVAAAVGRVAQLDIKTAKAGIPEEKPSVPKLFLWREALVQAESPRFAHRFGPLASFREIHDAALDTSGPVVPLGATADLEQRLRRMESSPWGLIHIQLIQPPKIEKLPTRDERGSFAPGSLYFELLIVDPSSGKVLARGRGQATNSATVEVRGTPGVLESDLKTEAEKAAKALAAELLR